MTEKDKLQAAWEEAARKRDTTEMQVIQQKMNQLLMKEGRKGA